MTTVDLDADRAAAHRAVDLTFDHLATDKMPGAAFWHMTE